LHDPLPKLCSVCLGPKKGPRGGLKWLIILIFKNFLLVNQQCQKIDTWHITLINLENRNPVWPNEFDLQLGCCISYAFSIFPFFFMFVFKKYDRQSYVWSFMTKYLRFLCKFTSWSGETPTGNFSINIWWVSTVFSTSYLFLDTAARLQWPVTHISMFYQFFLYNVV
jgi:hypothetical protein